MTDPLERAYIREQDELDRQLANCEITGTEYRKLGDELFAGYAQAHDEEEERKCQTI